MNTNTHFLCRLEYCLMFPNREIFRSASPNSLAHAVSSWIRICFVFVLHWIVCSRKLLRSLLQLWNWIHDLALSFVHLFIILNHWCNSWNMVSYYRNISSIWCGTSIIMLTYGNVSADNRTSHFIRFVVMLLPLHLLLIINRFGARALINIGIKINIHIIRWIWLYQKPIALWMSYIYSTELVHIQIDFLDFRDIVFF